MRLRTTLLAISAILVTFACPALAQNAIDGFKPDVNGFVSKVELGQGRFKYIAGSFTTVNGTARSSFARLHHNGSLDTGFNPAPNAQVQDIAIKDNQIIVVGGFSSIGGGPSGGIARLGITGTNDGTFTAAISGAACVVIQPDGKVITGGHFTTVGGVPRSRLARFNADGTLDMTFAPNVNNAVFGIALQPDGKIIIAGQFTSVDGQDRFSFARLNSNGTLDAAFGASLTIPGANGTAHSAAVQADGQIVIVGNFTTFGGFGGPRNRIVRLDRNGAVDASFAPSFDGTTYDVKVQPDGKLLVGGQFTTVNGATRGGIARINMNGTVDTGFVTNTTVTVPAGYIVHSLELQSDGAVVVGGEFTQINGTSGYNRAARLYPDGRLDADTVLSITGGPTVTMVSLPNGQTLLGGGFTNVGGATRQGMARIGWTGANDSSFANPQLTGWVYSIAVQADGRYLAGGDFTSAGGGSQAKLARIQTNGAIDGSFAPTFNAGGWVQAVAVQPDGKIIIVGGFTTVNGVTRTRIARLNSSGSLDMSFNASADQAPQAIALQSDGKILIGGAFENVGGQPRIGLARLNTDGTVDSSFAPAIDGIPLREVYEVTLDRNGLILIGGSFATVNGVARSRMARLHGNGALDTAFVPPTIDGGVLKIIPNLNRAIYIAGRFSNVGGIPTVGVAQLTDEGQVVGFPNTAANDVVLSMTLRSDTKILLGGSFTSINGQPRPGFAALRSFNAGLSEVTADSGTIVWFRGAYEADVTRAVFERSTDGVNYTVLGEGTRGLYGNWGLTIPNANAPGFIRVRGYADDFSMHRTVYEKIAYIHRPATRAAPFDFDGDSKSDIGIFRASGGEWWINRSSNGSTFAAQFGVSTDRMAPADFTGDGKVDIAIFRPSSGDWYILRSEDFSFYAGPFGTNGDIPTPADYDNDGRADIAVFRPSNSTWYTTRSSGGIDIQNFGSAGDLPVPADYDGDGRADIAIYRPSSGQWWLNRSTAGVIAVTFGNSTDKPVQGDYTGDGKADVAIWRPSTGEWFVLRSENWTFYGVPFGTSGDIAAPGDYDGDGKFDTTVFRPSNATWYVQRSTAGTLIQQFGVSTDRPVENAFIP
jgi:uncharacterized delta-60 repeat protein